MIFRSNNHFVPELYLKRFSSDGVRVFEYRTLVKDDRVPKWSAVAMRKLTKLKHLYSFVTEGVNGKDERSDDLERYFDAAFEAPAEEAINRAVNRECMSLSHWRHLARFFGLQHLRTPAHYLHTRDWWSANMKSATEQYTNFLKDLYPSQSPPAQVLKQIEDLFLNELGIPLTILDESRPEEPQIRLRFNSVIGRRAWLIDLKRQLAPDGIVKDLHMHNWTVLRSPAGESFVTSDRPAINIYKHDAGVWEFGAGWYQPGAVLYMPLSPQCLLYTQVGYPRLPRNFVLSRDKLLEVNRTIVSGAVRSILSWQPQPYVEEVRPRRVDAEAAEAEQRQLDMWDEVQTTGDRNR